MINEDERHRIKEIEKVNTIASVIIKRRQELEISQRTISEQCSFVACIEPFKTIQKLHSLVKLIQSLNLQF